VDRKPPVDVSSQAQFRMFLENSIQEGPIADCDGCVSRRAAKAIHDGQRVPEKVGGKNEKCFQMQDTDSLDLRTRVSKANGQHPSHQTWLHSGQRFRLCHQRVHYSLLEFHRAPYSSKCAAERRCYSQECGGSERTCGSFALKWRKITKKSEESLM
jgi:hypothetical protein